MKIRLHLVWEIQEEQLIDWHFYDLPDQTEINRSNSIASYQGITILM